MCECAVAEAVRVLKMLESSSTPAAKKRMLMKSTFGDYRKKMADELRQIDASQLRILSFLEFLIPFEWPRERTEHLDVFLFPPITQWCSISDVLFTGGRGVSDCSILKYY